MNPSGCGRRKLGGSTEPTNQALAAAPNRRRCQFKRRNRRLLALICAVGGSGMGACHFASKFPFVDGRRKVVIDPIDWFVSVFIFLLLTSAISGFRVSLLFLCYDVGNAEKILMALSSRRNVCACSLCPSTTFSGPGSGQTQSAETHAGPLW